MIGNTLARKLQGIGPGNPVTSRAKCGGRIPGGTNEYRDERFTFPSVKEKPAKRGDQRVCQIGDESRRLESISPNDAAEYGKKNVF